MFCRNCGGVLNAGQLYCAACGAKVMAASAPVPSPGPVQAQMPAQGLTPRKQLPLWVVILAFVCNLPGGAMALLCRRRGEKASAAGDVQTAKAAFDASRIWAITAGLLGVISLIIFILSIL